MSVGRGEVRDPESGAAAVWVRADNPGPLTLDGTRTWVAGSRRPVVVDPGPDDPAHRAAILRAVGDRRAGAVCLTHAHPDHAAGAGKAARALGCGILASRRTLVRTGLAGEALRDGDRVPIDGGVVLEALETPGHSADHLCYLWRGPEWLFTGDLVLGSGSSVVLHPDGSVAACLDSLARLETLAPRLLLPGHGEPVDDAVERLRIYREHREARIREVEAAVEGGARTPEEILEIVYADVPPAVRPAAVRSAAAHVAYLRGRGVGELPEPPALPDLEEDGKGRAS